MILMPAVCSRFRCGLAPRASWFLNLGGGRKVACVVAAPFARADVAFGDKLVVCGLDGDQTDAQLLRQRAFRRQFLPGFDFPVRDVVTDAAVEIFVKGQVAARFHIVEEHLFVTAFPDCFTWNIWSYKKKQFWGYYHNQMKRNLRAFTFSEKE